MQTLPSSAESLWAFLFRSVAGGCAPRGWGMVRNPEISGAGLGPAGDPFISGGSEVWLYLPTMVLTALPGELEVAAPESFPRWARPLFPSV